MRIRGQRSNMPGGWSLFLAYRGGVALTCFGLCLLLLEASSSGSPLQGIAAGVCLSSVVYIVWAVIASLRALSVRRHGRPGTARIEAIQEVFALSHPRYWPGEIRDRNKARLVFTDNFGKPHRSLVHPRSYFGALEEGSQIGVYVGKRRSWWNGDVGRREVKPTTSRQPAGQSE